MIQSRTIKLTEAMVSVAPAELVRKSCLSPRAPGERFRPPELKARERHYEATGAGEKLAYSSLGPAASVQRLPPVPAAPAERLPPAPTTPAGGLTTAPTAFVSAGGRRIAPITSAALGAPLRPPLGYGQPPSSEVGVTERYRRSGDTDFLEGGVVCMAENPIRASQRSSYVS